RRSAHLRLRYVAGIKAARVAAHRRLAGRIGTARRVAGGDAAAPERPAAAGRERRAGTREGCFVTQTLNVSTAVTTSMTAAVLQEPGHFELVRRPVPDPAPGQVRVKLEGCGVCASNLAVWDGKPWFEYPLPAGAPGHEAWGRVDATGDGVAGIRAGDRVAILSDAGYAEYDLADASRVVPLPASLDDRPFPAEPLGCALNIFARSRIEAGQTVAIVGI